MIERRQRLCFTFEPADAIGVPREHVWEDLECHYSAEAGIDRAVDLSHPSSSQGLDDLVSSDANTGRQSHRADYMRGASIAPQRQSRSFFASHQSSKPLSRHARMMRSICGWRSLTCVVGVRESPSVGSLPLVGRSAIACRWEPFVKAGRDGRGGDSQALSLIDIIGGYFPLWVGTGRVSGGELVESSTALS